MARREPSRREPGRERKRRRLDPKAKALDWRPPDSLDSSDEEGVPAPIIIIILVGYAAEGPASSTGSAGTVSTSMLDQVPAWQ